MPRRRLPTRHRTSRPRCGSWPPPRAIADHLHGMVVLEVFGHTSFIGEHQAEVFRMAMRALLEDIHRRIPTQLVEAPAAPS